MMQVLIVYPNPTFLLSITVIRDAMLMHSHSENIEHIHTYTYTQLLTVDTNTYFGSIFGTGGYTNFANTHMIHDNVI